MCYLYGGVFCLLAWAAKEAFWAIDVFCWFLATREGFYALDWILRDLSKSSLSLISSSNILSFYTDLTEVPWLIRIEIGLIGLLCMLILCLCCCWFGSVGISLWPVYYKRAIISLSCSANIDISCWFFMNACSCWTSFWSRCCWRRCSNSASLKAF